jgi:hypothetical protein
MFSTPPSTGVPGVEMGDLGRRHHQDRCHPSGTGKHALPGEADAGRQIHDEDLDVAPVRFLD